MSARILDGKETARIVRDELKERVARLAERGGQMAATLSGG